MSIFKRHRRLLFGAGAASVLIATPALAEPIPTATANVTPRGGTTDTVTDYNGSGNVSAYNSFTDGNNHGDTSVFANAAGVTHVDATVFGSGAAGGTASFTENILNTSTSIVDYYYSFRIASGNLQLDDGSLSVDVSDTAIASMSSLINVNGSTIWSIDAALGLNNGVYSVTDDNSLADDSDVLTNLSSSSDLNGASMSWSASIFRVHLGSLLPNQQMTMDYFLSSSSFASYAGECSAGDGYGYGDYGAAAFAALAVVDTGGGGGTGGCYYTSSLASDPGGIDGLPILGISAEPRSTGVPEPATLALMGVGLAGMGLARRRFKKS